MPPINILLVDDEVRNLDVLETILEAPAYRLLRALDADQALRMLLDNDVAAIVLDIKMPGISGFELAKLIKGTKKFRQVPLVFLTAYHIEDKDVLAGYGTGAVDYLTKPVNPDILRHKVAVFADLFEKTRALAELNETLERRVKERTAELEHSEAALRDANVQKDRFLATLAHELRNPLAPLRTGVHLLLRQPDPSGRMARTLASMNRQLDHMVRLIDDLLDVSRISRGRLDIRRERVDLGEAIARAIETMQPFFSRRAQSVVVEAEGTIVAFADPTRVAQIVGNLLHNASKHSANEGVIRVKLLVDGDMAIIRVIDDGVGIPSDQLERVFDMFSKVERETLAPNDGLGIGLALSRQLAHLHGGTLEAASAGEGKGATFTLSMPIGVAASSSEAKGTPHPERGPAPTNSLRVVLVEDNEDAAESMSAWLESLGHSVRVAHTGNDGVALVLDAKPDIVLCDVGLPGMDGVAVCQVIVSRMAPPPVMVALTGWGMEHDRLRTSGAGFQHHLVKPVDLDRLEGIMQSIERRAPAERPRGLDTGHVAGASAPAQRHGDAAPDATTAAARIEAKDEG